MKIKENMTTTEKKKNKNNPAFCENLFITHEARIANLSSQLAKLEVLYSNIQDTQFDDEDRQMVSYKIADLKQIRQTAEETLRQKRQIYETQIKQMQIQLDARQTSLETCDTNAVIFQDFPDILQYFVQKQTRLNHSLEQIKKQLSI